MQINDGAAYRLYRGLSQYHVAATVPIDGDVSFTFVTVAVSLMQDAPTDGEAQVALAKR